MERQRSGRLGKVITVAFAISFVLSLFFSFPAFAATSLFQIQSVELAELSATAEGNIMDFNGTNIRSGVTFRKLNDTAKYVITIRNTDDKDHIVEGITDNNTSPYISYEYDQHANERINAGADFTLVITAKYAAYIPDFSESLQADNVKFQIRFTDYVEEIVISPNTNDDITFAVITLVASAVVIVIGLITLKRHKRASRIIAVGIVIFAAATATDAVRAIAAETSDFALMTNFTLEPGRRIIYDGNYEDDGEMSDSYWTADGTLRPNAYTVDGYHFAGWSLVAEEEKVYDDEERMSNIPDDDEPLTLYAVWAPNTYTIVFHANSEQATGSMEPITVEYDSRRNYLPYNQFVLNEYRFIGWRVDNGGSLISDHNTAGNFVTENGATVDLYAQWELIPEGIDYYPNGSDVVGTTPRQENFGRTTMLQVWNYKRDGYGFAGWNTEPDGTGTMYGPNETVTMPAGGLKLYATWVAAEEGVTMQTFDDTAEPYASYPNGKVIALRDNRDNQTYTVVKLADGKWWMTENLRLVPTNIQFTAENTNNPASTFQPSTITSNICTENTVACINKFAYHDSGLKKLDAMVSGSTLILYGDGVYYNAYAATVGHAEVDTENLVTGQVAGDICPKGWHLPTSGIGGDYSTLDVALGGPGTNYAGNIAQAQKYFKAPINMTASGWAEGIVYKNLRSDAIYFARETDGMNHNVGIFVDNAIEIAYETTQKYRAHTVRCLAD